MKNYFAVAWLGYLLCFSLAPFKQVVTLVARRWPFLNTKPPTMSRLSCSIHCHTCVNVYITMWINADHVRIYMPWATLYIYCIYTFYSRRILIKKFPFVAPRFWKKVCLQHYSELKWKRNVLWKLLWVY